MTGTNHMWDGGAYFWGGPFAIWLLVGVPFAIGFYFVAGRIGRNRVLWAVLSLIPFVNYVFWIYAWFVVLLAILDRLNALAPAERP